jgi:Flp pilus assembly protein protease CpaA
MILNYLFLPMIFLIGLITSYQDFRYGKIKNKWIILGLAWGLGIYLFFLIWGLAIEPIISFSYIFNVFVNGFIALIVGYLLWYFNFWSAGDAKLFALFAFLLPLEYYWRTVLPYFPSFVLLINIFIPVLVFYLIKYFVPLVKLLTKKSLSKNFQEWLIEKKITLEFYFKKTQDQNKPFAVWMLIGVILTIILEGSFLSLIILPLLFGA